MKKFSTPLAINGTEKELRALIPKLEELGYKQYMITDDFKKNKFLITQHNSLDFEPNLITNLYAIEVDKIKRIQVSAPNSNLVLALAAMTEGGEWIKGEWGVCIVDASGSYSRNKLYQAKKDTHDQIWFSATDDLGSETNGWHKDKFRKPTKEEIIQYFSVSQIQVLDGELREKKIIGYKVKANVNQQAAADAIGAQRVGEDWYQFAFKVDNQRSAIAAQLGILDLLFEPIYEQPRKFVEIYHGERGKREKLTIEIVGRKDERRKVASVKGYEFTKEDLQEVLVPSIRALKFQPTHFNVGCNGQYKYVSAEDIQKVIDAL